jgi:hypothetical protein
MGGILKYRPGRNVRLLRHWLQQSRTRREIESKYYRSAVGSHSGVLNLNRHARGLNPGTMHVISRQQ